MKTRIHMLKALAIPVLIASSGSAVHAQANRYHIPAERQLSGLRETFAHSREIHKPPFPAAPALHRKTTATASRLVAAYYSKFAGAGFVPTYDSTRYFWSGERGGGTDLMRMQGADFEIYLLPSPTAPELFTLTEEHLFLQHDSVQRYDWNDMTGAYSDLVRRTICTLNAEGLITDRQSFEFNSTTSSWDPAYRDIYTYLGDTMRHITTEQDWDGSIWENSWRKTYSYEGSRYSGSTDERWSSVSTSWQNSSKIQVFYDLDELRNSVKQSWDAATSAWNNRSRQIFTYEGGNRLTDILQRWTGAGWENSNRNTYVFNASGKHTEAVSANWDAGAWVNESRYALTYNAAGDLESWTRETWDGTVWEFKNQTNYDYTNNSGQITVTASGRNWDNATSSWLNSNRYLIVYNSYGQLTSLHREEWDSGGFWDPFPGAIKSHFAYEEFEDRSPGSVAGTEPGAGMQVYPSPARSIIYAEGDISGAVMLYDMQGRAVWQVTAPPHTARVAVPVIHLPPGNYILQATHNGKKEHSRVNVVR